MAILGVKNITQRWYKIYDSNYLNIHQVIPIIASKYRKTVFHIKNLQNWVGIYLIMNYNTTHTFSLMEPAGPLFYETIHSLSCGIKTYCCQISARSEDNEFWGLNGSGTYQLTLHNTFQTFQRTRKTSQSIDFVFLPALVTPELIKLIIWMKNNSMIQVGTYHLENKPRSLRKSGLKGGMAYRWPTWCTCRTSIKTKGRQREFDFFTIKNWSQSLLLFW